MMAIGKCFDSVTFKRVAVRLAAEFVRKLLDCGEG